MLRLTRTRLVPEYTWPFPFFPRRIGYYLEDHSNDWDLQVYTHPQKYREYYTRHEVEHATNWADTQMKAESNNYNAGLHFNGDGPFERELKRKGIQVDKYRLPSTVAMRRVHEMTILRRQQLEKTAQEKVAALRESKKVERPTWLDERDGPVNPHFLGMVVGKNYEDFALPRRPVVPAEANLN